MYVNLGCKLRSASHGKVEHPHQKAVIVSGFSATDRVKEIQQLGAGPYIKKPYTLETITKAVRKQLDTK